MLPVHPREPCFRLSSHVAESAFLDGLMSFGLWIPVLEVYGFRCSLSFLRMLLKGLLLVGLKWPSCKAKISEPLE